LAPREEIEHKTAAENCNTKNGYLLQNV